jgi:hypothetical protein
VQDIGEEQFLMLLFVMQTNFDDWERSRSDSWWFDQITDRGIDMRAIRAYFRRRRARDQAALRPRLTRACSHVVRIEQISEPLIEHTIAGANGRNRNCSKNQVTCARCHFVGLASGIDWMT